MKKNETSHEEPFDFRSFIRFMQERGIPHTATRLVALSTKGWFGFVRVGNAVPVRIGRFLFLFTVAHVLDQARARSGDVGELFAQPLGQTGINIDLCDSRVISTDRSEYPNRYDDPLDMCVIVPSDTAATELSKVVEFAAFSDFVDVAFADEPGYYFFQGLPGTCARFSLRRWRWVNETISFGSDLYTDDKHRAKHYHPACHLELDFDGYGYQVDGWASYSRLRPLPGVSGCGFWCFHKHSDTPEGWGVDRIKLAGIVQSVDAETRTLRASRVCFYLHMIANRIPELAEKLEPFTREVDEIVDVWLNWPGTE